MKEKKFDKKKIISILSNITFIAGIAIGIYVAIDIYLLRSSAPAGTCPFIDNRPMLYAAIGLLVFSLVSSFFGVKTKRKEN